MEDSSASDWFYLASKEGIRIEDLANSYAGPRGCGPDNNYQGPVYFFLDRVLSKALWREMNINAKLFSKRVSSKQEINARKGIGKFTGRQLLWMIYDHLKTDSENKVAFNMEDLLKIQWVGDAPEQIASFYYWWNDTTELLPEKVGERYLRDLLFTQLEKVQTSFLRRGSPAP